MINLIQPITVQQSYDGITHTRRWASWNWWWRKVDDDNGDGFPTPEPRTDYRSALPREFRTWRRLRIVKCDETFSNFFLHETEYIELELRSVEHHGAHETGGRAPPIGRAPYLVAPLDLHQPQLQLHIFTFGEKKIKEKNSSRFTIQSWR